jgi:hypothetical protein
VKKGNLKGALVPRMLFQGKEESTLERITL